MTGGFRGIKWGTRIETLKGFELIKEEGGVSYYRKINDRLLIDGAKLTKIKLTKIVYAFYKGEFRSVTIKTEGIPNTTALRDAVFEKYGEGWRANEFIERWVWIGKETSILLEIDQVNSDGALFIFSKKIKEKEERDKEIKAQRDAPEQLINKYAFELGEEDF